MTIGQSTEYRRCGYCDKAFVVRYKDQRYCNKWHRKSARLIRVIENDNRREQERLARKLEE